MSFAIRFNTLTDVYEALQLARAGAGVSLEVPRGMVWQRCNVVLSGFVSDEVFEGGDIGGAYYTRLRGAFDVLHSLSANTIYPERAFAIQPRSMMRDFANFFRGKAFRQVYESGYKLPDFADGCTLLPGLVLKRAPSYRFNYSRHVVALLRTIRAWGGNVVFVADSMSTGEAAIDIGSATEEKKYTVYSLPQDVAPAPRNTLYLPGGVWLYNRGGASFAAGCGAGAVADAVRACVDGCGMEAGMLDVYACLGSVPRPLHCWLEACDRVGRVAGELPSPPVGDWESLRLDGGDFEFMPSRPDVLGYADYCYDWVKRMGIDVNVFRDAVFDFGTNIEQIANDAYDLYPEFHNGPRAFDEAVLRWKAGELAF